jgi:hypothetical protein
MYKRPVRVRAAARVEKVVENNQSDLDELLRDAERREADKRRQQEEYEKSRKVLYKITHTSHGLFNAVGEYSLKYGTDLFDIYEDIISKHPSEILVASLKGGRFKELSRFNRKGVVLGRGEIKTEPNQLSLTFDRGHANIFKNGVVRILHILSRYIGTIDDIVYSLRSGQLEINKTLHLDVVGQILTIRRPLPSDVRKGTQAIVLEMVGYTISFYKSGVVQYKGKNVDGAEKIIKKCLDEFPENAFGAERTRLVSVKQVRQYKTRATNPPTPPDSFEGKCGDGYYCRPNAQGSPNCYKIPAKITASARSTVIEAYKRVGVDVPKRVRDIFELKTETQGLTSVDLRIERQTYRGKVTHVLKIGGRQCSRLTEDQIENAARRLHIPGVHKGMGVSKMCERLRGFAEQGAKKSFELDGVPYYIEGEKIRGALRKNGKPNPARKCSTLPVETLRRYATAMGIEPKNKTKERICSEMREKDEKEAFKRILEPVEFSDVLFAKWRAMNRSDRIEYIQEVKNKHEYLKNLGDFPYTDSDFEEWRSRNDSGRREFIHAKKLVAIRRKAIDRARYVKTLANKYDTRGFMEHNKANLYKKIFDIGKTSEGDIKSRADEVYSNILKRIKSRRETAIKLGHRKF